MMLLQISLDDFIRNVTYWNRQDGLGLTLHVRKPDGAVWSAGNCLFMARRTTATTTEVLNNLFRMVTFDREAAAASQKLHQLVEKYHITVIPSEHSNSKLAKSAFALIPPFNPTERPAWLAKRAALANKPADEAAQEWYAELQGDGVVTKSHGKKPGNPGLDRDELIYRLAMVQAAEEIIRATKATQKEALSQIEWRYGISATGVKKWQLARDKLRRLETDDADNLLAEVARFRKEKKETQ
jgi:hypothetical protein